MTQPRVLTALALVAYAGSVPLANWMISNVGEAPAFPGGPHTIPVGFGFHAPSGVLAIGVSLAARDAVQRLAGKRVALIAVAVGVALSFLVASPALAMASAVAFALGELADFGVYSPLSERSKRKAVPEHILIRERHNGIARRRPSNLWLPAAILASGVVGGIIDSLVFLQIAFGSTMFWQGQVLGKAWVALICALIVWAVKCSTSRGANQHDSTSNSGSKRQVSV